MLGMGFKREVFWIVEIFEKWLIRLHKFLDHGFAA